MAEFHQTFEAVRAALSRGAAASSTARYQALVDTIDALAAMFSDRPEYTREVEALLDVRPSLLQLLRAAKLATEKDPTKWN
jgi:hypothetical protein